MNLFSKQPKALVEVTLRSIPDNKSFQHLIPKNYRTRVKKNSNNKHFSRTKKYMTLGMVSIIAGIALFIGGGVSSTGTSVAKAALFDPLCGYQKVGSDNITPQVWPGLIGAITQVTTDTTATIVNTGKLIGNGASDAITHSGSVATDNTLSKINSMYNKWMNPYPKGSQVTAYEVFGTAGQNWNNERYEDLGASCFPILSTGMNITANLIFTIDQLFASIGLTIYGWAVNVDVFSPFFDTIKRLFIGDGSTDHQGLIHLLFLNYLSLIVISGALIMGWQGLVKKRSSEAIQSAIWMIGSASLILVFLSNPIAVASTLNDDTRYVTSGIISTLANVTSSSGSATNMCSLPPDAPLRGARMGQCSIWETFLYTPWVSGQFGNLATQTFDPKLDKNGKVIGYSTEVTIPHSSIVNNGNYPIVYLDAHVLNHDQAVAIENINLSQDSKKFSTFMGPKNTNEGALVSDMIAKYGKKSGINPAGGSINQAGATSFTGDNWTGRISVAFLDMITMFASMIPILTFTFSMITLQLMLIFLFLIAPFALTLGVNPGVGRKITMSWLEMVGGTTLKIIGNSFLLGILMFFIQAIMGFGGAWIIQVMMIVMACVGIMVYRKKILSGFKLNLGGNGARGSSEMQQARDQFIRNATTVVKDAVAFEGGFTKGVRSGLIGRNKNTKQLVTAGKDIKKAIDKRRDPLAPIETKVAQEQKNIAEKMAQDKIMEQTSFEDMDRWVKQYNKTKEPVPRPTDTNVAAWLEEHDVPMRDRVITEAERKATIRDAEKAERDAEKDVMRGAEKVERDAEKAERDAEKAERDAEKAEKAERAERDIEAKAIDAKAKAKLTDSIKEMTTELKDLEQSLVDIQVGKGTKDFGMFGHDTDIDELNINNRMNSLQREVNEANYKLSNWSIRIADTLEDQETIDTVYEDASVSNSIRIDFPEVPGSTTQFERNVYLDTQNIIIDIPEVPIKKRGPQNPLNKSE